MVEKGEWDKLIIIGKDIRMFCPILLQFSHRKMFYTLYVKDSSLNDTLLSTRTSTENEEGFSIKSKGGLR